MEYKGELTGHRVKWGSSEGLAGSCREDGRYFVALLEGYQQELWIEGKRLTDLGVYVSPIAPYSGPKVKIKCKGKFIKGAHSYELPASMADRATGVCAKCTLGELEAKKNA